MGARGFPPALLHHLRALLRDRPEQERSIVDLTTQIYGEDSQRTRRCLSQLFFRLKQHDPTLRIDAKRRRGTTYYRTTEYARPPVEPTTATPAAVSLDWLD